MLGNVHVFSGARAVSTGFVWWSARIYACKNAARQTPRGGGSLYACAFVWSRAKDRLETRAAAYVPRDACPTRAFFLITRYVSRLPGVYPAVMELITLFFLYSATQWFNTTLYHSIRYRFRKFNLSTLELQSLRMLFS